MEKVKHKANTVRFGAILVFFITVCLHSFAQDQKVQNDEKDKKVQKDEKEDNPIVDYKSDLSIVKDQGVYAELIGNVVFHHHGVFITCDTAYRYSEQRMEGVGNVIINSDSTFVYGDKFLYNAETNTAEVYAPLIKTVDGDAVMYTHNMTFNTLDNTGTYHGGGTSKQGTNIMESERGIYFSSDRSILLTGAVNTKNENYEVISDTISYSFDTKVVTFLAKANIWNHKGEFLVAEDGTYNTQNQVYDFYNSAYIMTLDRELWADSILYKSNSQSAKLDKDIQILDTMQQVISLGDKANYWGVSGRVLLSEDPATISYGNLKTDSIFLRADTMLVIPMLEKTSSKRDSLFSSFDSNSTEIDSSTVSKELSDVQGGLSSGKEVVDSLSLSGVTGVDSISNVQDTTVISTTVQDTIKSKPLTKREIKRAEKQKRKAIAAEAKVQRKLEKQKERDEKRLEKLKKIIAEQNKIDSLEGNLPKIDSLSLDSIKIDSLGADSLSKDSLTKSKIKRNADSSDFFIYAIRNVKSFKEDMQMVCDSMVVNSLDSTTTLYVKPIIWNTSNQITADSIKMFTRNEAPYKAEFYEFPIMAQAMRDKKYNQIRGKYMEAFFKGQSVDVLYVDGNSECIYYKEEGDPGSPLDAVVNVTSANMEIYFDSVQMSDLKWFNDIKFDVYPIDKMNEDTKEVVEGFEWHEKLRPLSRFSITKRSVRPSMRAIYVNVKRPLFTITSQIDAEKIKFIEDGIWRDRFEELPINKVQFINSLPK